MDKFCCSCLFCYGEKKKEARKIKADRWIENLHRKDREGEDRLSANTIRRHTPENRCDTSADHIRRA